MTAPLNPLDTADRRCDGADSLAATTATRLKSASTLPIPLHHLMALRPGPLITADELWKSAGSPILGISHPAGG